MKERIKQAKEQGKKIKLIFDYPRATSVKVRRGFIKSTGENSFDFMEDKDGLVTYKYKYIVEIKNE